MLTVIILEKLWISKIMAKLNEIIDADQKLKIGLDVINTRLDDFQKHESVDINPINNQRNKGRPERYNIGRGNNFIDEHQCDDVTCKVKIDNPHFDDTYDPPTFM